MLASASQLFLDRQGGKKTGIRMDRNLI